MDFSGSTFYSIPTPPQSQMAKDAQILDAVVDNPTGPVTPPAYDMSGGAESFAPGSTVTDLTFQPDLQPAPESTGLNLPMILGLGIVALWLFSARD